MEYTVNQISENTYMITEGSGPASVYMYLLVGSERAVLIDAGMGTIPLDRICAELTDKTVEVILTHAHVDHIGGAVLFDRVFLNLKDREMYDANVTPQIREAFGIPKALPVRDSFLPLEDGQVIDIGGRTLKILETPGHSKGSICILDVENRLLFTGDTCCKAHVLLNLDFAAGLTDYYASVRRLIGMADEYDTTYPGHHSFPVGREVIEQFAEAAEGLLSGSLTAKETNLPFGRAKLLLYKDIGIVLP